MGYHRGCTPEEVKITNLADESAAPARNGVPNTGCTEKDVKDLIGQWNKSKKMMKGMKGDRKMRRQMQSMMNIDDADFDLE